MALTEGVYVIVSAKSLLALDVQGASDYPGANVQQYTANGTDAQVWALVQKGDKWEIVAPLTGNSLDVLNGAENAKDGTNVQQYTRNGTQAQTWEVAADGKTVSYGGKTYDTYTVKVDGRSLVLDVSNGSTTEGANVQVYQPNQSDAQRWAFVPVAALSQYGTYSIVSALDPGVAVDVPSQSKANGCGLQIWSRNHSNAQIFQAVKQSDGTVCFVRPDSGKALDVDSSATPSGGTRAIQWDYNASKWQKWLAEQSGSIKLNGATVPTYELHAQALNDLCLDVASGKTSPATHLQTWESNHTAAQRWAFLPERYLVPELAQPSSITVGGATSLAIGAGDKASRKIKVDCGVSKLQCRYRITTYAWGDRSKSSTTAWLDVRDGNAGNDGWGDAWGSNLAAGAESAQGIVAEFGAGKLDRVDVEIEARAVADGYGSLKAYACGPSKTQKVVIAYKPTVTVGASTLSPDGLKIAVSSDFPHGGNSVRIEAAGGSYSFSGVGQSASLTIPLSALGNFPEDGEAMPVSVRWSTMDGATVTVDTTSTVSYGGGSSSVSWSEDADRHVVYAKAGGSAWVLVKRGHGDAMERFDSADGTVTVPYPIGVDFDVWTGKSGGGLSHTHFAAKKCRHFVWTWGANQKHKALAMVASGQKPSQSWKYTADVSTSKTDGRDHPTATAWHGTTLDLAFDGSALVSGVDGTSRSDFDRLAYAAGEGEEVIYRTPEGRWERVVVTAVDLSSDSVHADRLTVTQQAVSQ